MTPHSRMFRIFVSSASSDLKAERNVLQEQAFPRLRELVKAPGDWEYSSFHSYVRRGLYDLRWGACGRIEFDPEVGRE